MRFAVTALVATLACAGCALQAEDQEVAGDVAAGSVSKDAPSGVAVAKLPDWQRADTPGDAQKSATSGGTTVTKAHPSSPVPEPESSCMGQPCDPTPQPWEPDPLRKAMKK